jgi:hypothetical protein
MSSAQFARVLIAIHSAIPSIYPDALTGLRFVVDVFILFTLFPTIAFCLLFGSASRLVLEDQGSGRDWDFEYDGDDTL